MSAPTIAISTTQGAVNGKLRTSIYTVPELTRTAKAEVRIAGGRSLIAYHVAISTDPGVWPMLVVEYRQKDGTAAVTRIAL